MGASAGQKALIGGAIVAAGILGLYALGIFDRNGDEDRPPIIVKNGSILFENDMTWVPNGTRRWKPDHQQGKKVNRFDVTFTGVQCAPVSGKKVVITRTNGNVQEEYEVRRKGIFTVVPDVKAPVDMDVDNNTKPYKLSSRDQGGNITSVQVGNNTPCDTSSVQNVEIRIKPEK